jgi:DNA polymerase III sliding clamp (beta) subunit (PCNA family)
MDALIARNTLSSLLSRAASVALPKSPTSYLQCVLIEAVDGRLTARATNLMLGVETSALATVKSPGAVAVEAKRAAEIAKAMPAGEVRLRIVKNQLELSNGKSKFKLGTFPVEELPPVPRADNATEVVKLKGADLSRIIAHGSYCMDTDVERPQSAMRFIVSKEHVRAFSGLSSRMAMAEVRTGGHPCSMLFPLRSVAEIKSLADASKEADVTISQYQGRAFFSAAEHTLSLKLGDGIGFAPLESLFFGSATGTPSVVDSVKHEARFVRDTMLASFQRVHLVANQEKDAISVNGVLTAETGELRLSGATSTSDEGEDVLQCEANADLEFKVAPEFVEAALKAIDDDEVRLCFGTGLDPLVFRGTSGDSIAVVMPMRSK